MKIADIPSSSRPREKALSFGVASLTDDELIAILLGGGVRGRSAIEIAQDLLREHRGLLSLSLSDFGSLKRQFGISTVGALTLLSCFELGRRVASSSPSTEKMDAQAAFILFRKQKEQEELHLLCLDKRSRLKKDILVFRGTVDRLCFDAREVIKAALREGSSSFLLVHNHPGGCPLPSQEDVVITESVAKMAKEIGLKMADHVIIGEDGYYSFCKNSGLF